MTSETSQPTLFDEMELPSTSFAAASRARTSHSLETEMASKVRDLVSGRNMPGSLANYDPVSSSWKTSQACFLSGWKPFSENFPRSGMMRYGTVSQLPPSAPLTGGTEFGSSLPTPTAKANMLAPIMQKWAAHRNLWPTPMATDGSKQDATLPVVHSRIEKGQQIGLAMAVRLRPTPTASMANTARGCTQEYIDKRKARGPGADLADVIQDGNTSKGSLNPDWVEWLMGFPIGHTSLTTCPELPTECQTELPDSKPLVMPSCHRFRS